MKKHPILGGLLRHFGVILTQWGLTEETISIEESSHLQTDRTLKSRIKVWQEKQTSFEATAICDAKIGRGFVHGQLVCLALVLRTGCNSDYAILFPRIEFSWSSILTLKIEQADASKVPLRQLRLTSIEFAFSLRKVAVENLMLFNLR